MRGKVLTLLFSSLFIVGCANDSEQGMEQGTNESIQPINYETPEEQKERLGERDKTIGELGGYHQSEQNYVNEGDKNITAKNEDPYTNERTNQISDYLSERREVVQAQVAETEDRIIIGVMTGNKDYPHLKKEIERDVKQIVPDKEVVIITDKAWWDRMRNLNSNANQLGKRLEKRLDQFFNEE